MATAQATNNCITLKGSAQIIAEYLKYGVNSILFQRGIYPAESFESVQQYGLTILMSKDPKIVSFLKDVLTQTEEWLAKDIIKKISMTITNAHTREVLEIWDFHIQADIESSEGDKNPGLAKLEVIDSTNTIPFKAENRTSNKDLKRIQKEICDVMRQISATVSYLPLLDCICTFDLMICTREECEVPNTWDETEPAFVANGQAVQLRSFSTGVQKVNTIVNYKMK